MVYDRALTLALCYSVYTTNELLLKKTYVIAFADDTDIFYQADTWQDLKQKHIFNY